MKAAGETVIGFGAGEPDFPTPDYIVDAAVEACRDPKNHRYTPAGGLPELKEAIAAKTLRDSGFECEPGRCWSPTAASTPCTPPSPRSATRATRCSSPRRTGPPIRRRSRWPVACPDRRHRPTPASRPRSSSSTPPTPKTKVLLFVSPDNPSGAVYSPDEVKAIGEWALDDGIWVITDEIYEHLTYGDHEFASMPTLVPDLADQCIVLNGVAKTYAMTGWRVGWMIGPTTSSRRPPTSSATRRRTWPTSASGPRSQPSRAARRRRDDARGVRPSWQDDARDAQRDRRRHLHRAAGCVLLLPHLVRASSVGPSAATRRTPSNSPTSCSNRPRSPSSPARRSAPRLRRFSFALGDADLEEGIRRLAELVG